MRFALSGSADFAGGMGGGPAGGTGRNYQHERHEWIEQHCDKVDPSAYGGSSTSEQSADPLGMGALTLYDCGA